MSTLHSYRRALSKSGRIAATGALAGSLAAGAVAVAAPTPASAALNPDVRIAAPTTIYKGSVFTLNTAVLTNGRRHPGAVVAVQWGASVGVYKTLQTLKMGWAGTASMRVKPWRTTTFRVALLNKAGTPVAYSPRKVVHLTAPPNRGAQVVAAAARQAGKPYSYGAAGPNAFDCSGLTLYVYRQFGWRLPHGATAQARYGTPVSRSSVRAGDLILFGTPGSYYHAAIYAGPGYMWDAPTSGQTVGRHRIWSNQYVVRRLV